MTSSGFFKKKARRIERFFNMVECALALAVVAIGVVSIVALFPVGMEASRDAIADSYAADAAETLLHYKAVGGKYSATDWSTLLTTTPSDGKPDAGQTSSETGWNPPITIPGTTTSMATNSTNGLFKLEMAPDFSGVFRLWRSPVAYSYYSSGWKSDNLVQDSAVALNLEVSWPSQAPYLKRKRALYYLEVFNPN